MKVFRIRKFNDLLLLILLFFGLFDVARNYTKLPASFGYFKDVCVYALLIMNIDKLKLPKYLGKYFYCWLLCVFFLSPLGMIKSDYGVVLQFIAWVKFAEIFILIIIFLNWDKVFDVKIENYAKWYVWGSALLCFVNIFGYYVDNPIVSVNLANTNMPIGNYVGRITVGQPPIAIFPVILSFLYLMIFAEKFKEKLLCIIFLVCIVIATSNTGILSIACVFMILILFALFCHRYKNITVNVLMFLSIAIIGILVLFWLANDFMTDLFEYYFIKIGKYFNNSSDPSMDIRKVHWSVGFETMRGLDVLFGRGLYGYIIDGFYPIENTFVITFLMYGILGVIGLAGFLVYYLVKATCLLLEYKSRYALLMFCAGVIFSLHFYTLDLYFCYTLYFALALFIAFCYYGVKKDVGLGNIIDNRNPHLQSKAVTSANN